MDGRQFVQAHHVIGDHDLSGNRGESGAGVFEGLGGLADGVVRVTTGCSVEFDLVGFVNHGR